VPEIDLAWAPLDPQEELALAERAAEPTRSSLTRFEEEAPEEIRPMIAELRESFLVPGYTVKEMKATLLASSVDVRSFTRVMGVAPWQYALEAKMETASRLLRDTELSVSAVAFAVGYADSPQLSRIFGKWSGQLTPHQFRLRIREVVSRVGPMPEELVNWRFLERIWNGTAEPAEREELLRYLECVYRFEPCELAVPEEIEAG
jgi:AraC-like DNA-binding protein